MCLFNIVFGRVSKFIPTSFGVQNPRKTASGWGNSMLMPQASAELCPCCNTLRKRGHVKLFHQIFRQNT